MPPEDDVETLRDHEPADAPPPTFEDALELCASSSRDKKLVGVLLITRVFRRDGPDDAASDAVARALGAEFMDWLIGGAKPPPAGTPANDETIARYAKDGRFAAQLGFDIVSLLARSKKFAASKTMRYWMKDFVEAAGRETVRYRDCDDDTASCAFECVLLSRNADTTRGEEYIPDGVFEASLAALRRAAESGHGRLSNHALYWIESVFVREARRSESMNERYLNVFATIVPELCAVMRHSEGDVVSITAVSLLAQILRLKFPAGLDDEWRARYLRERPTWRTDCAVGLWVVLSSRTPKSVRLVAMRVAKCMVDEDEECAEDAPFLLARDAEPPAAVLAGAVSSGAKRKVPSFLALVMQIVRLELQVNLHTLLRDDAPKIDDADPTKWADAHHGTNDALELFERVVRSVVTIADLEEKGKIEFSDQKGRLNASELTGALATMDDVTSTLLDIFEDETDRNRLHPTLCGFAVRSICVHVEQAPHVERARVENLLPYWCGPLIDRFSADAALRAHRDEFVVEVVRHLTGYTIVRILEDADFARVIFECGWWTRFMESMRYARANASRSETLRYWLVVGGATWREIRDAVESHLTDARDLSDDRRREIRADVDSLKAVITDAAVAPAPATTLVPEDVPLGAAV